MVWHPKRYAELLSERIERHGTAVWLVNTGWTGGGFAVGERIPLKYSRAIVDSILNRSLKGAPTLKDPWFGLDMITQCLGVPEKILQTQKTWKDPDAYDMAAKQLAGLFIENFKQFKDLATKKLVSAGPIKY